MPLKLVPVDVICNVISFLFMGISFCGCTCIYVIKIQDQSFTIRFLVIHLVSLYSVLMDDSNNIHNTCCSRMRANTSLDIHVLQYISSYFPDDVIFRFLWDPFHMTENTVYRIYMVHYLLEFFLLLQRGTCLCHRACVCQSGQCFRGPH